MALFQIQFFSETLRLHSSMHVILPDPKITAQYGKLPTLYLLHGLSDDHTIWLRRTSIERYVAALPLAVVMPAVGRSFYSDTRYRAPYWTFVSEELPSLCETYFPLSAARENRFAAGLSMGGYGALKLGLRCPGRYAAVASLSGAVDIVKRFGEEMEDNALFPEGPGVFGSLDDLRGSEDDLTHVAKNLVASGAPIPSIYMCCGTEDFLLENNRSFVKSCGKTLNITYDEFPGAHTWDFWDTHIQHILRWLPIKVAAAK